MKKLTKEELYYINAGDMNGAFLTSIITGFKYLYGLGQILGNTIRTLIYGKSC